MTDTNIDWRDVSSPNRIKFLNVISNKRKLFKNNNQNEDQFFNDFTKFQRKVVRENETLSTINFDQKFEIIGNENIELNKSAIYCSFRLGAFMQVPLFLLERKVDIIILVSKESYAKTLGILQENGIEDQFELIIVNDATGFRKIIKESRNGKSFYCLLDVGSSLNKDKIENENRAIVDLNGVQIETMIGIPYLSYYLDIPLIPFFSYRIDENTVFKIEKPVVIENVKDRFDFGHRATPFLWKRFESYLNKYPSQWESIYYIHRYYSEKTTIKAKPWKENQLIKFRFNNERYDFVIQKGKFYLYDYETLEAISTSEYIYTFLNKILINNYTLTIPELKSFIKEDSTLNQFFSKELLIEA